MHLNRLGTFTLGVIVTAASIGLVSFANAASDVTLKACANKTTGVMRYIAKGSCKKSETSLSWNQIGPQGLAATSVAGAKGDTGAAGAKGDTGATVAIPTTTVPSERIGDIGPGGGPIFFVDTADLYPFTYLEVAPSNATENAKNCAINGLDLSMENTTSGPLTSDVFGQGRNNTLTLLALCNSTGVPATEPFATFIDSFKQGWFIPNIAEMKTLINAEKFGLISLARPLRDPISATDPSLMTSSIYPNNYYISNGISFWGWGPTSPESGLTYSAKEPFTGNAIRLIRAM